MMLTDEQRVRVCAAARAYKGTPWMAHGRDHRGIDCNGLIVMSFRDAGFEIDEGIPNYRGIDSRRLVATLRKYCNRVITNIPPIPADIVVYGVPDEAHCVLIVDGDPLNAIHCPLNRAVVESRFDHARGKIRGIYRWR